MKDFISLSQSVQIVAVIIITVGIVCVVYFLSKKGIKATSKLFSFSVNSSDAKEASKSPHISCKHNADAICVLKKIQKHTFEKLRLVNIIGTISRIDLSSIYAKRLVSVLAQNYLKILSEKGVSDPSSTLSFSRYKNVLSVLEYRIFAELKYCSSDTYFIDLPDEGYRSYVETKINQLSVLITDILNDIYTYNNQVTRSELYESNMKISRNLESTIEDFFFNCRQISSDIKKKMTLLILKLKNYLTGSGTYEFK